MKEQHAPELGDYGIAGNLFGVVPRLTVKFKKKIIPE